MTTENIKELSEKLAKLYDIEASIANTYEDRYLENGEYQYEEITNISWLAEDSGRVGDLADNAGIGISHGFDSVIARDDCGGEYCEEYRNYPSKAVAARMAKVNCLIAIKENE